MTSSALKPEKPITWNAWTSRLKTLLRLTLITISKLPGFFENTQAFYCPFTGRLRWTLSLMGNTSKGGDKMLQGYSRPFLAWDCPVHCAFLKTEWHLKGFWNSQGLLHGRVKDMSYFGKLMSFQVSCAWLSQVTMKRGSNSDFNDMPRGALRTTAIFILDSAGPRWTKGGKISFE